MRNNHGTVLAIDAMGGDRAPEVIVAGTASAFAQNRHAKFLFFGKKEPLEKLLQKEPELRRVSQIVPCERGISSDAKPSSTLRTAQGTSIHAALTAVKNQEAQAMISAGNTGALMVLARFILKTLEGIDRPAICQPLPSLTGRVAMLDLGANMLCDARNLSQFALMGLAYAESVMGVKNPTCGLLNVGEEKGKGREEVQQAAELLRNGPFAKNFYGFVEGDDIMKGVVDVAVTDGFTGNTSLKTIEGFAYLIKSLLKEGLSASWKTRLGYLLARPAFQKMEDFLDHRRYNGAMFLGLNGLVVKSHGGTDAFGFANAVTSALQMLSSDSMQRFGKRFSELPSA